LAKSWLELNWHSSRIGANEDRHNFIDQDPDHISEVIAQLTAKFLTKVGLDDCQLVPTVIYGGIDLSQQGTNVGEECLGSKGKFSRTAFNALDCLGDSVEPFA
jgi:hypothetical protein